MTGQIPGEQGLSGFAWFTLDKPFEEQIEKSDRLTYAGRETIGGVECHVIESAITRDVKRFGYTYPLLLSGDPVAGSYRAVMLPTLYVIGTDGKILHAESGAREGAEAQLETVIESALR